MQRLLALMTCLGWTLVGVLPAAAQGAPTCRFVLGFQALHDLIPTIVGDCLTDEQHNPVTGDGLQPTITPHGTAGLLVWRKADNWTAFTDGYRSWIDGPNGLQERLNTERFAWEANPDGLPVVPSGVTGIDGMVTEGPITPVCRVDVPCSRPIAAMVTVEDPTGRPIFQFTSGADGHFRIDLPPGTYILLPAMPTASSFYPRPLPATVTVPEAGYATVTVGYDTGIR